MNEKEPSISVLLYTEESGSPALLRSPVIGMISDIIGTRKLIVIRDPINNIDYVYRISTAPNNLDAVSLSRLPEADFIARKRVTIDGDTHKLAPPSDAVKLLNGQTRWIQDKGSILSVLLQGAAGKPLSLTTRTIDRPRLTEIPANAVVEDFETDTKTSEAPQ